MAQNSATMVGAVILGILGLPVILAIFVIAMGVFLLSPGCFIGLFEPDAARAGVRLTP